MPARPFEHRNTVRYLLFPGSIEYRPMRPVTYPEQVAVRLPAGWRARLAALAERDQRGLGEYLRNLMRKHLESAERDDRSRRQSDREASS